MINLTNYKVFISILLVLFVVKIGDAKNIDPDYSGKWCWDENSKNSTFSLHIKKNLNIYKGAYFAVAYEGERIDINEEAFAFKVSKKNSIITKIKAGIRGGTGIIRLTIIKNKLEWRILKEPKSEFYAPQKAFLTRCG